MSVFKSLRSFIIVIMVALFTLGCGVMASSTVLEIHVEDKLEQQFVIENFVELAHSNNLRLNRNKRYYGNNCVYEFRDLVPKGGSFNICMSENNKRIILSYDNSPVVIVPFPKKTAPHRRFQKKMLQKASLFKGKYKIDAKWFLGGNSDGEDLKIPNTKNKIRKEK